MDKAQINQQPLWEAPCSAKKISFEPEIVENQILEGFRGIEMGKWSDLGSSEFCAHKENINHWYSEKKRKILWVSYWSVWLDLEQLWRKQLQNHGIVKIGKDF